MDRRQFTKVLVAGSASSIVSANRAYSEPISDRAIVARGQKSVVATVHPLASQAALDAFHRGGNAVDAAVAASLMLSVVDVHNSGLGGGGLALVRTPEGKIFALDGRERAPLTSSPESFIRNGKPEPSLSQTGPLAAATPGLAALLERMSQRFGAIGWQSSLIAAAKIAESGFPIDAPMARNLASNFEVLKQFPETARVLLNDEGKSLSVGQSLVQSDLADTLRNLARHGTDWFYRGPFAERADALMRSCGGLLSKEDFAQYYLVQRQTIECDYRSHRIVGFPPPSSGGLHIAQMLKMLSGFDVRKLFEETEAKGLHLLAETMKRAMADRAYWLGDADFAKVPRGLMDSGYLSERANSIDLNHSTAVAGQGVPPNSTQDFFGPGKHTTHLTTADQGGYVVALTQTINTSFGSKMMVPGTGVLLNNEMDDFSLAPGVRNAFGLVGSQANAVAPGKRPLSSMSPTIVLDPQGAFRLSCGAAGGPKIITAVLQTLIRTLDLRQTIDQALRAPRIHHQWSPDILAVEEALSSSTVERLTEMGHKVERGKTLAVAQGIERTSDGQFVAASDPRVPSRALAI